MSLSEATRSKLGSLIESDRVVLFMKGDRAAPQCGFSARVVQILDSLLPKYTTVDVLRAPDVREGIKELSAWPTIPQLYVDGEFLGGCDIVSELYTTGELKKKLEGALRPLKSAPCNRPVSRSTSATTTSRARCSSGPITRPWWWTSGRPGAGPAAH